MPPLSDGTRFTHSQSLSWLRFMRRLGLGRGSLIVLLRHNYSYDTGRNRLTVIARRRNVRGCRPDRRARADPRPATRNAHPPRRRTDPPRQRRSTPAATNAAPHHHRKRRSDPVPTSAAPRRTRTPAPPTDETDGSHEQFAAHRLHRAQLTALVQAHIESFFSHLKGDWPHLTTIRDPAVLDTELARVRREYNTIRLHASIGYVTPDDEHHGRGPRIRRARAAGMRRARAERIKENRATRTAA
jgi:hypothetical protein